MARQTFNSNVKNVATNIEKIQTNYTKEIQNGLAEMALLALGQVQKKSIVSGNWAKKTEKGNLVPTTPPGANLYGSQVAYENKKTGFKRMKKVLLYIKGKVVGRSGKYEETIANLSSLSKDSIKNASANGIRVKINRDGIKVYADSDSEFFKLETQGKDKKQPLTKSFRSIVNLWSKVRVRLDK